jgi:hypothetical protein
MPVDLKRIRKGRLERPPRILIYGPDGVGKTYFSASSPNPFIIDANRGSSALDVARVDAESWEDCNEWLGAIETKSVACETVVLDAVTDLEVMSHNHLFPNSTVTKHDGGWGKGDDVVVMEWRKTLAQLERLWNVGHTIVLVGHARVRKFEDPTMPSGSGYDRFELGCRPLLAALLRQWVDFVLFAREEVVVAAAKGASHRATTTGARYAYTRRCPAYDAKARGSGLFPEKILLSWDAFESALKNDRAPTDDLRRQIDEMLSQVSDPKLTEKVHEYLKKYPRKLVEAFNNVSSIVQQKMVNETVVPKEETAA